MVIDILRILEEGKTSDEVIKAFPQLSVFDVSACIEYATELVIIPTLKFNKKNK
jgi:uncharacterized protein (DUF433 family)